MANTRLKKIVLHLQTHSIAVSVLVIGCILSCFFAYMRYLDEKQHHQFEFELVCKEIQTKINTRLHSHALLLRNAGSFYSSSDTVTRAEWKYYFASSYIEKNMPGIQGLGFSYIIPKQTLQKHIQQIRNEGYADYTIKPSNTREVYTSIMYLEPFNSRNLRAFGYDMYSESVRRHAMQIARDSNIAALSGKVHLKQETNKDIQIGTLMYVPVFKKNMPITTVIERRKAIVGWAYSPYRMNDLMKGILGGWSEQSIEQIHLQIYDNAIEAENSLLYDSKAKNCEEHTSHYFSQKEVINFNGKKWLLVFSKSHDSKSTFYTAALLILLLGMAVSFLLYRLLVSLAISKKRIQLANTLTKQLFENEFKFKTVADNTYEWEYWEGLQGQIVYMSPSCERVSGYAAKEFMANPTLLRTIIHPDDQAKMNSHFMYVHAHKESTEIEKVEFRIIKKNGEIAFLEHLCLSVFNKSVYLGRRVSNRDVTVSKQAEIALQQSEIKFKNIFNFSTDGIVLMQKNFEVILVNNTLENMLGYTKERILGKCLTDYIPLHYSDIITKCVDEINKIGQSNPIELEFIKKQGDLLSVEINSKLLVYENSEVMLCIVRDISERKKHEKEIFNIIAITEEKEKEAFAKELHDGLGPILSTCKIYTSTVNNKLDNNTELHVLSSRALELIDDGLLAIKEVSNKLSPHILRNYGLLHAINAFIAHVNSVSNIQCTCVSNFENKINEVVEFAIYRIITELINNTLKHAEASIIEINLEITESVLQVLYSDNGKGFDFNEIHYKKQGFGIVNIENRIKMMDGEFSFKTGENKGVQVSITLDLQKI